MFCFVARPGGKFAPKVKSKRGISSKGRSNVNVGVSSSTEEPMRSDNYHDINLNNGELCYFTLLSCLNPLFCIVSIILHYTSTRLKMCGSSDHQ